MRSLCSRTIDRLHRTSKRLGCQIALCAAACVFSVPARAEDRKCSLVQPTISEKDGNSVLQIKLKCGADAPSAATVSTSRNYLIGLTVYSLKSPESGEADADDKAIAEKLRKAATGRSKFSQGAADIEYNVVQKPRPAGATGRMVIADDSYGDTTHAVPPYDFPTQAVRVSSNTGTMDFNFTVATEKVAEHNYFLFALWPESQKKDCDANADAPRSGCKSYGYVIGDDGDVRPVDFYPGMATLSSETLDGASRWIVERFR